MSTSLSTSIWSTGVKQLLTKIHSTFSCRGLSNADFGNIAEYPLIKLCGKFWSQCSSTEHCILEAFGSKCVCVWCEPRLKLCFLLALCSSASDSDAACDVYSAFVLLLLLALSGLVALVKDLVCFLRRLFKPKSRATSAVIPPQTSTDVHVVKTSL